MLQESNSVLKSIQSISANVPILSVLTDTHGSKSLSHSIFELEPVDEFRSLDGAKVAAVSPWALDALLHFYEDRKANAAAEFYKLISGISWVGSLWGRVMERQLLKYFNSLLETHTFKICSLTNSTVHDWKYPGPTQRVNFEPRSFTSSLLAAVDAKQPLHLVLKDPNFPVVDSIVYDPNAVLTGIQSTITPRHPEVVSGFRRIQGWLTLRTPLAELRPSTSGPHWHLIFAVPETMAQSFCQQGFEGDTTMHEWERKVDQYVLAVNDLSLWGKTMKV